MKTTKLGIAVMALMGAFAQKADPMSKTHKITAPKPEPKRNVSSSGKRLEVPQCRNITGSEKDPARQSIKGASVWIFP